MIKVSIYYNGETRIVICHKAKSVTNRQVACYNFIKETVEYYDGRIIFVEAE